MERNENTQVKIFAGTHIEVDNDIKKWLKDNNNIHIISVHQSESMAHTEDLFMNLTITVWFMREGRGVKVKKTVFSS